MNRALVAGSGCLSRALRLAPSGRTIESFPIVLILDRRDALKAAKRCTFLPFWVANKGAGCSGLKSNDRFWAHSGQRIGWIVNGSGAHTTFGKGQR
jgi:hypothetical protein